MANLVGEKTKEVFVFLVGEEKKGKKEKEKTATNLAPSLGLDDAAQVGNAH